MSIHPAGRVAFAVLLSVAVSGLLTTRATAGDEAHPGSCNTTPGADVWRQAADGAVFLAVRTSCPNARDIYPDGERGRYALRATAVAIAPAWSPPRVRACLQVAADLLHQCDIEVTAVAMVAVSVPESFLSLDLVELNAMAHATPGRSRRSLHTYFIDRFAAGDAMASAIAPAAGDVAGATVWITTRTAQRPHTPAADRRLRKHLQRQGIAEPDSAELHIALNDVKCGMSLAHEFAHLLRDDHIVVARAGHDERGHARARGNVMAQGEPADAYLQSAYRFTRAQCRDLVATGVANGILHDRKSRRRCARANSGVALPDGRDAGGLDSCLDQL